MLGKRKQTADDEKSLNIMLLKLADANGDDADVACFLSGKMWEIREVIKLAHVEETSINTMTVPQVANLQRPKYMSPGIMSIASRLADEQTRAMIAAINTNGPVMIDLRTILLYVIKHNISPFYT